MPRGGRAAASLAVLGALVSLAASSAIGGPAVPDSADEVRPAPAARVLRARSGPGPSFAIVAIDSAASSWGAACAEPSVACGTRVPVALAGAGAAAVLGAPSSDAALAALDALRRSGGASAAVEAARAAPGDAEARQVVAVDAGGVAAASSGRRVRGWSGRRTGRGYACVGQGLDGGEPLEAMAAAFEAATGDLSARLLAALVAAARAVDPDGAFGDAGGNASAALLVVRAGAGGSMDGGDRLVDLRVDAAEDPIPPLARLYDRIEGTYLAAAHVRFGDRARQAGDDAAAAREYRAAEAGFRAGLGRNPKSPDALNELAWFLATHGGDPGEALRYAAAAVEARGDDPNLYDTLAEAAYRSGDLERAIAAAERASRLARGDARYAERLRAFQAAKAALVRPPGAAADSARGVPPSR